MQGAPATIVSALAVPGYFENDAVIGKPFVINRTGAPSESGEIGKSANPGKLIIAC
jgi:hypothetical protein